MTTYYMKAWTVLGHTFHGSAYCLDHTPTVRYAQGLRDMPQPIFASDEYYDMTCDICHEEIGE
jgi:hypothetical protein